MVADVQKQNLSDFMYYLEDMLSNLDISTYREIFSAGIELAATIERELED